MKTVTEVQRISPRVLANLEALHCSTQRRAKPTRGRAASEESRSGGAQCQALRALPVSQLLGVQWKDHPFPSHQTVRRGCRCTATCDSRGADLLFWSAGEEERRRRQTASASSRSRALPGFSRPDPPAGPAAVQSNTPFSTSTSGSRLGAAVWEKQAPDCTGSLLKKEAPPSWARQLCALSGLTGRAFPLIHREGSWLGKERQVQSILRQ